MEKLQKLFLNVIFLVCLFSCNNKPENNLSKKERKNKSRQIQEDGANLYQGSPESMIRLEKAIEMDPENFDAWRELSIPYLKRGIPYKWKKIYDKTLSIKNSDWRAWRGYNYLWFYRDYKKAINDFNTADNSIPNFTAQAQGHSVDYWRGIAYLGLKDYKNSIYYFDKYIEKETKDIGEEWVEMTAFLYEGIAHYENKNDSLALESFNKLLKYTKNDYADGNYYKALILEKKGDYKEALELTNSAIQNYKEGYYNYRAYVETLRQLYPEDFLLLKERLTKKQ